MTQGNLGSFMMDILKGLNLESRFREQKAILIWDEAVGEKLASAAQPEYVRDGRIFVTVKSSVWANELTFYKSNIIKKLNDKLGRQIINEIVFKVGKISAKEKEKVDNIEPGLEGIQLTDMELEKLEETVKTSSGETSELVKSLLVTALKLEKWKKAHGWKPCAKCGDMQNSSSEICPLCRSG